MRPFAAAFTLMEVMIALGIFFMCSFAILAVLATSLRNARALQRKPVDAGMVAAQLSLTNRVTEGIETGDFEDMYPDYTWMADTYEEKTNGLFKVDMIVERHNTANPGVESKMSILLYRPESQPGSLSGGGLPRR